VSINKKHGLGRGINSLLGDYAYDVIEETEVDSGNKVIEIPIDKIKTNPNLPRRTFNQESLDELRESIEVHGVIQPIIVEEIGDGNYSIIAGERRYRASKLAGKDKIPAIVRSFSDIQRLEVSLIENIQRENLNPVEEAKAFSYLLAKSGIKQEDLARRVGKSRSAITNSIRLLSLPEDMQKSLYAGDFTPGHARALLSVLNPADREILYKAIMAKSLSVRKAEEMAAKLNKGDRNSVLKKEKDKKEKNEYMAEIEEKFLSAMGTRVELKGNVDKGKIEIKFNSAEELERIYQLVSNGDELFDN